MLSGRMSQGRAAGFDLLPLHKKVKLNSGEVKGWNADDTHAAAQKFRKLKQ